MASVSDEMRPDVAQVLRDLLRHKAVPGLGVRGGRELDQDATRGEREQVLVVLVEHRPGRIVVGRPLPAGGHDELADDGVRMDDAGAVVHGVVPQRAAELGQPGVELAQREGLRATGEERAPVLVGEVDVGGHGGEGMGEAMRSVEAARRGAGDCACERREIRVGVDEEDPGAFGMGVRPHAADDGEQLLHRAALVEREEEEGVGFGSGSRLFEAIDGGYEVIVDGVEVSLGSIELKERVDFEGAFERVCDVDRVLEHLCAQIGGVE